MLLSIYNWLSLDIDLARDNVTPRRGHNPRPKQPMHTDIQFETET